MVSTCTVCGNHGDLTYPELSRTRVDKEDNQREGRGWLLASQLSWCARQSGYSLTWRVIAQHTRGDTRVACGDRPRAAHVVVHVREAAAGERRLQARALQPSHQDGGACTQTDNGLNYSSTLEAKRVHSHLHQHAHHSGRGSFHDNHPALPCNSFGMRGRLGSAVVKEL